MSRFKGKRKRDALVSGSCKGLKLTYQILKIVEKVFETMRRQKVDMNEAESGFGQANLS